MVAAFRSAGLASDLYLSAVNTKGPVENPWREVRQHARIPSEVVGFREALFTGLAPDGGLYHPVDAPDLARSSPVLERLSSFQDVAAECMRRPAFA